MKSSRLETQYYVAELHRNILHVQYKPYLQITLADAKEIVAQRVAFFQDLQYPVLIKRVRLKSIDRRARAFLFQEGLINVKAIALVESHSAGHTLATFLFGVETPTIPYKMFEDEPQALSWLLQYV